MPTNYAKNYNVPNKPAEFSLNNILLPVTPHTFKVDNDNQNLVDQLVDGDPVTIARLDGAQTLSIDFLVPLYPEPFLYDERALTGRKAYTDYLWQLKQDRAKVVLTINYPDGDSICFPYLLQTYSYTQSAENGSDYDFSITLVEYYPPANLEMAEQIQNQLIAHGIRNPRRLD